MLNIKSKLQIAVWAIDPFEGKLKPHRSEVRNLLTWVNGIRAKIQPVYVLKLERTEVKEFKVIEMERAIGVYLQEINCSNTLRPKVLISFSGTVEDRVEKLNQYSDEIDAEMIIVSSRGRKGLDRFIFGSFAETLLLQSKRPLYFLTHQRGTIIDERRNKVLFATDFSKNSELAFSTLLEQAKDSSNEIVLYYAITLPPASVFIPDNYCDEQKQKAKTRAESWIKRASSKGIKVSLIVEYVGDPGNVANSIINIAKEEAARFVALASSSGKIESLIFGSVAREVFRTNLFPVWTWGPHGMAS